MASVQSISSGWCACGWRTNAWLVCREVQPGDCVVAFSRKDIFEIKSEIEQHTRHKCCVVYGALPPETRRQQVHCRVRLSRIQQSCQETIHTNGSKFNNMPIQDNEFTLDFKAHATQKPRLGFWNLLVWLVSNGVEPLEHAMSKMFFIPDVPMVSMI